MKQIRRFVKGAVRAGNQSLGEDQCEITLATSSLALDGDIWDMGGADLSQFQAHPVLLFNHQQEIPVARASNVRVGTNKITATATFPPTGVSAKADEVRGLVKSGILTGVSAGIIPLEDEPLDPRNPRGGRRITKWTLIEASFVAVPSDAASTVTARAAGARGLPFADPAFAALLRSAPRSKPASIMEAWARFHAASETMEAIWDDLRDRGRPLSPAEKQAQRYALDRAFPIPRSTTRRPRGDFSFAARQADKLRLTPRAPLYSGDMATWAHAMREWLEGGRR